MNSFFQTPEWEQFKLKTGYSKSYRVDDVLILQRSLPLGQTMLYSPLVAEKNYEFGIKPCLPAGRNQGFIEKITKIGKANNAIFYRLELDIPMIHDSNFMIPKGFVKAFEEMQPENNWVVDISKKEEDILAGMKQKGRYNIRIAKKNNIAVTSSNTRGEELDAFYDLYSKTGKRKGVTFRGKAYFENLLDILGKIDYARAYTAKTKIDGKDILLAAAIVIFYAKEALYLYGGSSDEYKNLMTPYLLHWEIMLDAKKAGMEKYNFLGIAPSEDQSHPWAGITRFKKQFGGYQEDIMGSYDLIFNPIKYQLFKIAEKIRRK